ncbi:hypothetical protein B0H13DRAFT_2318304 [Mycena leptocephala]|nr:hypothetical protein B0H13DRAFT_2318304 [Mycena leptocephala]
MYPGLKINAESFAPHIIRLVDPIWLGVQALIVLQILFPRTPIVTSQHTNLSTYAEIFGGAETARVRQLSSAPSALALSLLFPSSDINPAPSPLPPISHPILPRVLPHSPSFSLSSSFAFHIHIRPFIPTLPHIPAFLEFSPPSTTPHPCAPYGAPRPPPTSSSVRSAG